jgi:hypothetical protein
MKSDDGLVRGFYGMSAQLDALAPAGDGDAIENAKKGKSTEAILGWFSVGMAVATLGILVATEILSRYQFKKRTPYDFYSNAGEKQATEFGMGI